MGDPRSPGTSSLSRWLFNSQGEDLDLTWLWREWRTISASAHNAAFNDSAALHAEASVTMQNLRAECLHKEMPKSCRRVLAFGVVSQLHNLCLLPRPRLLRRHRHVSDIDDPG